MRSRRVLLVAAGLHMVTEVALTPFYPALFRAAFGVQDFAATGWFIALSRIAAVVALPLWGRATRWWSVHRLVLCGQTAAVLLTGALALAPNYAAFTAIGMVLVAAKSVVLLAYPSTAGAHPGGLLRGVRQYVATLQIATVLAVALGASIVNVPDPMRALPLLAVVEAALLIACAAAFRAPGLAREAQTEPLELPRASAFDLRWSAALVLGFAFAGAVVRPYFTEYAEPAGPFGSAFLFALAHVAALVAAIGVRQRPGLAAPFAVAAAGLVLQAVSTDPLLLALGRVVFGAALGLGQIALDVRVLTAARGSGARYGRVAAAQHTGLLVAPLMAAGAATWDLGVPLVIGGGVFALLATASLVPRLTATPFHPTPPEVSDVPVRSR